LRRARMLNLPISCVTPQGSPHFQRMHLHG
jgi:hypothetical protein